MLRLAFDFIITWRETRTRPNAYASRASLALVCQTTTKRDSAERVLPPRAYVTSL